MIKTGAILGFCTATSALVVPQMVVAKTAKMNEKPNIILILVDDLGYSDLGCYGGEIETPNIDHLAEEGIRYRTFYNMARSAPTRASLMTGLYAHQAGVGCLNPRPEYPNYQGYLNEKSSSIPYALKEGGYFSIMTGKWHLGWGSGVTPITRGFDRSLNAPVGGFYYYDHKVNDNIPLPVVKLFMNDQEVALDSELLPKEWYSTNMWVENGLKFVDEALDNDQPFFWYLAFNAPHFPLQAPEQTIEKYRGRYSKGWREVRDQRYKRQLEMGLFSEDEKLTPMNPQIKDWNSLPPKERKKFDHQMAIYAATIDEVDQNVGRLVKYLKEKGIYDNTMIIFLSDNGGNGEPGMHGVYRGKTPGAVGSNVFLGASWGNVANTPFFLYKHHAHEGGCNTPFIVSYPNGIDSSLRGSIDKRNMGHLVDIMPTLIEVGGGKYPTDIDGHKILPMEGTSLLPALSGKKVKRKNPIIVEHEGNKMLRDGDWKVVQENEESQWRLYNMKKDPTEMNNLADKEPKKLKKMVTEYERMAKHTEIDPSQKFPTGKWYTSIEDHLKQFGY